MALTVLNEHARTTATAQKDAAARRFSVAVPNVFVIDLLCQEIGGELELLNMLLLTRDAGKRRMKQK